MASIEARSSADPTGPSRGEMALGAAAALGAFFVMLRRALVWLGERGELGVLVGSLARRDVRVEGRPYRGFEMRERAERASPLLPVRPEDVVGNDEYLRAGLRLARDVAGYDFERGLNPKHINPVLFGLGRPGTGKTVTAHAVGHYFLDYCRAREVPARFLVIRRTDWASSYQNASANNLVRFFEERVYGFDGVCGVYWPDIDTAFASRSSSGLRQEEKQNLGAVFGVFDGTLLPRDGKWFLICDANNMHMDEATISRIAQNPVTVEGPTEPEQYIELMRDILLDEVRAFLPEAASDWEVIGAEAARLELSGRNVDAICGNIRAHIQDFEYPDDYFASTATEREQMIEELSRPVDREQVLGFMRDWDAFRREVEARADEERFRDEVESIVRRLNAGRAAGELLGLEDHPLATGETT
jgi:SpoVK/Ycf46/Vps4 family AAA+-type ATPase